MDAVYEELNQIKQIDFGDLECRLWVIKRRLNGGDAAYTTVSANINGLDADFQNALSDFFVGGNIHEPINTLSEYSPLTVELDEDRALVHDVDETDLRKIIDALNDGADNDVATKINQFHNAWALVVEFWGGDNRFVAFSKIKGGWNIKQSKTVGSWVFNEGRFEKVQQQKVFSFRNVFDFICFNEANVFVRNKVNYELGLNVREGLMQKRDDLIEAFAQNGILASADDLKVAIGTNKTLLRRLVSAEENRYFEDQEFIEGMKAIINEHNWDLEEDENGCFLIDENNVDLFLKLINDKRFLSLIRKQMVDSDVVEPVEA